MTTDQIIGLITASLASNVGVVFVTRWFARRKILAEAYSTEQTTRTNLNRAALDGAGVAVKLLKAEIQVLSRDITTIRADYLLQHKELSNHRIELDECRSDRKTLHAQNIRQAGQIESLEKKIAVLESR